MAEIDWNIFDNDSESLCHCRCGHKFMSHVKLIRSEFRPGFDIIARQPCPACGSNLSLQMVSSGPEDAMRQEMKKFGLEHKNVRSFHEYSEADLIKRAIRNANPKICGESRRWVAVADTFGVGSTYAHELCRLYGIDPSEHIQGVRCIACEP